jgi:serine/threonine-protein kinase
VSADWSVPGFTEIGELGRGAGGIVVQATDAFGRDVAIKYLSPELLGDQGFREAFRTEARLLAGLDSPHVARLFEYVEGWHGAAIIMELVAGTSLRQILANYGPTEPEGALVVLKGSLLGLQAAHSVGVVHRDYKPENVLVTSYGESKLVDFGVATRVGGLADGAGTPAYMSPEQWVVGGVPSPQGDIYAATATFIECLTGSPPFVADDLATLRALHARAPIPEEMLPKPVRALARRGMSKNPAERPSDAGAFLIELERAAFVGLGRDWEQRGIHDLARRVALLAVLFQSGMGAQAGGTSFAHTQLGTPTQVASPAQPGGPGQPGGQAQPGGPGQSGGQAQPGGPGQSGGQAQPGGPGQPGGPAHSGLTGHAAGGAARRVRGRLRRRSRRPRKNKNKNKNNRHSLRRRAIVSSAAALVLLAGLLIALLPARPPPVEAAAAPELRRPALALQPAQPPPPAVTPPAVTPVEPLPRAVVPTAPPRRSVVPAAPRLPGAVVPAPVPAPPQNGICPADQWRGSDGDCHNKPHCKDNEYFDDGRCKTHPEQCDRDQYLGSDGDCHGKPPHCKDSEYLDHGQCKLKPRCDRNQVSDAHGRCTGKPTATTDCKPGQERHRDRDCYNQGGGGPHPSGDDDCPNGMIRYAPADENGSGCIVRNAGQQPDPKAGGGDSVKKKCPDGQHVNGHGNCQSDKRNRNDPQNNPCASPGTSRDAEGVCRPNDSDKKKSGGRNTNDDKQKSNGGQKGDGGYNQRGGQKDQTAKNNDLNGRSRGNDGARHHDPDADNSGHGKKQEKACSNGQQETSGSCTGGGSHHKGAKSSGSGE